MSKVSLKRWFQVDSHWQNLRVLFNPTLTRFFVSWFAIAPVAIKILEGLPPRVTIPWVPPVELTLELPFFWWVLWWASFFYATSFVIFTFGCPGFIKQYKNYHDYTLRGHSPRWLVWEFYYAFNSIDDRQKRKLVERVKAKEFGIVKERADTTVQPVVGTASTTYVFEYGGEIIEVAANERMTVAKQKEIFWEIFALWASAAAYLRMTAWIMFYVSLGFAAFVTIQQMLFVLSWLFCQ